MGLVHKFFVPNSYAQSIFQIDLDKSVDKGVKGIITNLDNTLVDWDVKEPTGRVKAWFKEVNEKGITITIVSNNNESHVASFSQHLDIGFIFKVRGPMGKAFDKTITKMNIRPGQTVVIGDQMLTDVFGGNRRGLYTTMVVPVKRADGFITKFNRLVERRLLRHFSKKGYITWGEN